MPKNKEESKSIRDGFGEALLRLGDTNKHVVALTADLGESLRMSKFAEKYPENFIQVGIAEQNMAGIAAGLALSGKIAFMGSFASFQPMRNLDQIRSSICIMNANVKVVSSHAGFSYPGDGIQIQVLEDLAIMRSLPNMKVLVPADAEQAETMTLWAAETDGPVYLRLGRAETAILSKRTDADENILEPIVFGKAQALRRGSDATLITCGYMVGQSLLAAAELALAGVHVRVINMHTIKPLDTEAIIRAAEETGRIVSVEEHQSFGGLGSAVAEVLAQSSLHPKFKILAVQDRFGETGEQPIQLWESRGLGVKDIVRAVRAVMS